MKQFMTSATACLFLLSAIAGCSPKEEKSNINTSQPEPTIETVPASPQTPFPPNQDLSIFTTQNNISGNHVVDGSIDLVNAAYLDISMDGVPIWLVSAPMDDSAIFTAIMEDGSVHAFKIAGSAYEKLDITRSSLPSNMPPLIVKSNNGIQLVPVPEDASPLTNPLLINNALIYITSNGDLVINHFNAQTRLPIDALPDARILLDDNNRLLVLTQPTTRYDHGVLADNLEASAITLIETKPEIRVAKIITIVAPDVIEGISPIWADIDDDGARDIIVTLSNNQSGARIAAFREDGSLLAETSPIGLGHRWRHQIAVAQFTKNQPPLLVSIRTPHIGGIVEFFQYKNGKLETVSEIQGFSSHTIGSRNLDSALAGDFNNDGIDELLAPDQAHANLGIISTQGAIATLPLDGTLTSNLSAISINGQLFVGAGTQGKLRIWTP